MDKAKKMAVIVLTIAATWCGAREGISLAVVPFAGPDSSAEAQALGHTIAEHLTSFFAQSGLVQVVERAQMEQVLSEMALGQSGLVDESQALETGKMVGATHLTVGRFSPTMKGVSIQARIVAVESGTVIASATVEGDADKKTFDQCAAKLLKGLGIEATFNRTYRVKRTLGFTGIGGGVVAAGFAIWSHLEYTAADEMYRTRYDLSAREYSESYETAELHKSMRVYLAGTSVLLLAFGVYALLSNDAEWEFSRSDEEVTLRPYLGRGTAGLVLHMPITLQRGVNGEGRAVR